MKQYLKKNPHTLPDIVWENSKDKLIRKVNNFNKHRLYWWIFRCIDSTVNDHLLTTHSIIHIHIRLIEPACVIGTPEYLNSLDFRSLDFIIFTQRPNINDNTYSIY